MFKKSFGVLTGIAVTTLLSACDIDFDYESIVDRSAIRVGKKKWEEQNIKDYTFVYQERCACDAKDVAGIRVEVADDHAVNAVGAKNGVPFPEAALTIDQLFDHLLAAAKDGSDKLLATFDSERHFIKRVTLDPDENTQDDEYGFEIPCFSSDGSRCVFPLITPEACADQEGAVAMIPTLHPEAVCDGGLSSARGQTERDVSVCCVD